MCARGVAGLLCPRRAGFSGVALRSPPAPLSTESAQLGQGGDRLTPHRVGRSTQCAQHCRCPPPHPGDRISTHKETPPWRLGSLVPLPLPAPHASPPLQLPIPALHALFLLPLPLPKTKKLRSYPTPPAAYLPAPRPKTSGFSNRDNTIKCVHSPPPFPPIAQTAWMGPLCLCIFSFLPTSTPSRSIFFINYRTNIRRYKPLSEMSLHLTEGRVKVAPSPPMAF